MHGGREGNMEVTLRLWPLTDVSVMKQLQAPSLCYYLMEILVTCVALRVSMFCKEPGRQWLHGTSNVLSWPWVLNVYPIVWGKHCASDKPLLFMFITHLPACSLTMATSTWRVK